MKNQARVIVTDLTVAKKPGRGKVAPEWFFPPFSAELEDAGLSVEFTNSADWLNQRLVTVSADEAIVLLHVFNEEQPLGALAQFAGQLPGVTGVFNPPELVEVIAQKSVTNRFLASSGVPVPEIVTGAQARTTVFSNAEMASHAPVQRVPTGQPLSAERYNTRLIETARSFQGRRFYSSVRLMCVGSELVAAMIRLRDVAEGDPSVHTGDTPLDAEVVTYFQRMLVDDRMEEWRALAKQLGKILAPAFYAHDIVVETPSERSYVCEVGLKINDYTYAQHLSPITGQLPASLRAQFADTFPRHSARAFLRECVERGWL